MNYVFTQLIYAKLFVISLLIVAGYISPLDAQSLSNQIELIQAHKNSDLKEFSILESHLYQAQNDVPNEILLSQTDNVNLKDSSQPEHVLSPEELLLYDDLEIPEDESSTQETYLSPEELLEQSSSVESSPAFESKDENSFIDSLRQEVNSSLKLFYNKRTLRKDYILNPEDSLITYNDSTYGIWWTAGIRPRFTQNIRADLNVGFLAQQDNSEDVRGFLLTGYLQFNFPEQGVFTDIGKVKTNWSPSFYRNPSNLLVPKYYYNKYIEEVQDNEGTLMGRIQLAYNPLALTLIVAELDTETFDESTDTGHQLASKLTLESEGFDFSLLYNDPGKYTPIYGYVFTFNIGDSMVVYAEGSATKTRDRPTPKLASESIEFPRFLLPATYDYEYENAEQSYFRKHSAGFQYTWKNGGNIIFELYHNGHGYDDDEAQLVTDGVDNALEDEAYKNQQLSSAAGNPHAGFLKNTQKMSRYDDSRQNYIFARFLSPLSQNNWQGELVTINSADDTGWTVIPEIHKTWKDTYQLSVSYLKFISDNKKHSELLYRYFSEQVELEFSTAF